MRKIIFHTISHLTIWEKLNRIFVYLYKIYHSLSGERETLWRNHMLISSQFPSMRVLLILSTHTRSERKAMTKHLKGFSKYWTPPYYALISWNVFSTDVMRNVEYTFQVFTLSYQPMKLNENCIQKQTQENPKLLRWK